MREIDCHELYRDGRHYDLQNADVTEDIPYWVEIAREAGGPVLELCCGTGRISFPLAEAGFEVTGIDASEAMLDHARYKMQKNGLRVEFIHGDVRDFDLGREFKLVFIPFNSINHLHTTEDIESFFGCVKRHLAPGGKFAIDIFVPNAGYLVRDPEERRLIAEYDDPDGGGLVTVTESNLYNPALQINHVRWFAHFHQLKKTVKADLNMRMFFPQELDMLLKYNGFSIEAKYGDYKRGAFKADSIKQLFVCVLSGSA